ncbi:hypothetical protein [Nonomuraea sp. NPDC003709]
MPSAQVIRLSRLYQRHLADLLARCRDVVVELCVAAPSRIRSF